MLNLDQLIKRYRDKLFVLDQESAAFQRMIDESTKMLSEHNDNYRGKNFLLKVILFIPYKLKCWSYESDIYDNENKIKGLPGSRKEALKDLVMESARSLMNTGNGSRLWLLESRHKQLNKLYQSAERVRIAGVQALSEVESAMSTVEEAQSMEIIDGFTDSNFVSTMSTVQNYSASSAVDDAMRTIKLFQSKLEEHQHFVSQTEHSKVFETMDLTFDILFGGVLDVLGSVLSYLALSNTQSQLREAYSEVAKAIKPLKSQCQSIKAQMDVHERELLDFKQTQRELVVPLLKQRGVDVSIEFASSITDLYAKSALS